MKKYICTLMALATLLLAASCEDTKYPIFDAPDANRLRETQIFSFDLDLSQFKEFKEGDEVKTVIHSDFDSITVFVPWYVDKLLRPTIAVSDSATLSPISGSIQDFSEYKTYTVRAQNGDKRAWKIAMKWMEEPEPLPRSEDPRRKLEEDHPKYPLVKFGLPGNAYGSGGATAYPNYIGTTSESAVNTIYFIAHHEGELQMALRGRTASGNTGTNTFNVRAFINGVPAKDDNGTTDYNHDYTYGRRSDNDTIILHRIILPEVPEGHVGHQVKLEIRGKGTRSGSYYYRFYEMWTSGWATRGDKGSIYKDKRSGISFSYNTPRDGRAAPSIHMDMVPPQGNMEYFYTEVTIPEGGDALHTYFMTAGNSQGYTGIQTNYSGGVHERRFLFSIWAAIEESDPATLKSKYNPKIVRVSNQADYRKNMTIQVFGGEGTGGQSYINVNWKTGETYKVLVRIRPHPDQTKFPNSTLYKAWFHNGTEWMFMCEWRRQEVQPGDKGVTVAKGPYWYNGASHFVEDFNGEQGDKLHKAYFSNHWYITNEGDYVEPTGYKFTGNQAYGRADVAGGVETDGPFANSIYLKSGGYFTDIISFANPFKKPRAAIKPDLDLEALNAMGTDDPDEDKRLTGFSTSPINPGEKYTE